MKIIQQFFTSTLLFLVSILILPVYAQDKSFSYVEFGSENGLPSSEVYEVLQDKKGMLWFCTDAGVSRYNGYEFVNFNTQDGLTDNTIFHLYEDFKGRLWFLAFNNRLCYFYNDSIYEYQYNNLIKESITQGWVRSISIDSNENLFYAGSRFGYGSITKAGHHDFAQPLESDTGVVSFYSYGDELIVWGQKASRNSVSDNFTSLSSKTPITYLNKSIAGYNIYQKCINKNQFIFSVGGRTCLYNNGNLTILNTQKGLHQAYVDRKNRLWLAYHNDGILIYENLESAFNGSPPVNHVFGGKNVTYIFKDNDEAVWVTTQNSGVFYLPNIGMEVFSIAGDELTNRISTISDDNQGNIYFGTFDSQIFRITRSLDFTSFTSINSDKKSITKIDFSESKDGNTILHNDSYFVGANDCHWSIEAHKLYCVKGYDTILSPTDYPKSTRFNVVYENQKKMIFAGSNDGLYYYVSDKLVKVRSSLPFSSVRIEDVDELKDGTLLIGTKDNGLYLWKNDTAYLFPLYRSFTSAIIRDIYVDEDDGIWISTPNGVNSLKKINGNYEIQKITDLHGLPSKEVNSITSIGDEIWVATNRGVARFYKNELVKNPEPPRVYFHKVSVNEESVFLEPNYKLMHDQNYLEIEFCGLSYRARGNVLYRYKMEGIDLDWIESYSRKVRYPSLNPGEYAFLVQAANEDEVWSKSERLSFIITPPFWRTNWFIVLLICILLLLLLFIIKIIANRKAKKEEINRNFSHQKLLAAKSELKALRAQMNPHFTFNTLSAIQSAINSDSIDASQYIVDFAKLIRKVLENSKHAYISLAEEIATLELYIKLEQLRFSHKFSYEIEVLEDFDFIEIPSMVIQPYVENAILHGLSSKKEGGKLNLQFFVLKNNLICIVEDNGVGREKALKAKSQNKFSHKSMGMEITGERIEIYKKELGEELSIKIIDLKNENGQPEGTRVEMTFPL